MKTFKALYEDSNVIFFAAENIVEAVHTAERARKIAVVSLQLTDEIAAVAYMSWIERRAAHAKCQAVVDILEYFYVDTEQGLAVPDKDISGGDFVEYCGQVFASHDLTVDAYMEDLGSR